MEIFVGPIKILNFLYSEFNYTEMGKKNIRQ